MTQTNFNEYVESKSEEEHVRYILQAVQNLDNDDKAELNCIMFSVMERFIEEQHYTNLIVDDE